MKARKDPKDYKPGEYEPLDGCFTEEYFIRGMSLMQIFLELGLPMRRLEKGAWICWAEQLPQLNEFHLGGWAKYATDNFVNYSADGKVKWNKTKFMQTLNGQRVPLSIGEAKQAWRDGMRHEKLVKIVPIEGHNNSDEYPEGRQASQIIVTNLIRCRVMKKLEKPGDIFMSVWG